MKRRKLGCLTTGAIIAIVLALGIVTIGYAMTQSGMFSPGGLNAKRGGQNLGGVSSHAELEKDCAACHTAPWDAVDMAEMCLGCHQDVSDQMADTSTLHGAAMSRMSNDDCRVCHTEHNGPEADLTKFLGGDFPHDLVGFSLLAHEQIHWSREVVCADCHQEDFSVTDNSVCLECHKQVDNALTDSHVALFGEACLSCHDGLETYGAGFNHDHRVFPLDGRHADAACIDCHNGAKTLEMMQDTPQSCVFCHKEDDSHKGSLGSECGVCHTPKGWTPAVYDHSQTGFVLEGGHADLECETCHDDPTFQGLDSTCISCHADDEPHEGKLSSDCALCHTIFDWNDLHFDHSGIVAQGCRSCHVDDRPANHYSGGCAACHNTNAWVPATFDHSAAGASDCISCHGGDAPRNHYSGQCSACHSTTAWLPASFNHPYFPINHGGAGGECQLCHTSTNYSVYTCYGCHEHSESRIRSEHERVSDLNNCIRCHPDGREHEGGEGGGGGGDDD